MLQHFSREDAGIKDAIAEDGACIVDNFLPDTLRQALLDDFIPHLDAVSWNNTDRGEDSSFFGFKTKRLHGLVSRSEQMKEVMGDSLLHSLATSFLGKGDRCKDIRISTMELMVLGQDQEQQAFHTDADSWAHPGVDTKQGDILFSANIALTPFTPTNGATVVVPGSHHWPSDRQPQASETCQAVMDPGAALLYSGNVIHAGGHNQESAMRAGLYVGFLQSHLRPLENHLVTNKLEDVQALPEKLCKLLDVVEGGYTIIA